MPLPPNGPGERLKIDAVVIRDKRRARGPGPPERRERVRESGRTAVEIRTRVRHGKPVGRPQQGTVQARKVQSRAGCVEHRQRTRELPFQFVAALLKQTEGALEPAVAVHPPRLIGKVDLPHALEVERGIDLVALFGPFRKIHVALHARPGSVRDQIDLVQANHRTVNRQAGGHRRRHREVVLDLDRAAAETRRADVRAEISGPHEIEIQIAGDHLPGDAMIEICEFPPIRVHEIRRHGERHRLRGVPLFRQDLGQAVLAVRPALDGHLPVRHPDFEEELLLPQDRPPRHRDDDLLR